MKKPIGPNLKLTVTKGPSSGFSSEFTARHKVNVGRVVNGNKLSIKDAGISSKHLALHFVSGSGQWTITDLDSSNGTILNSKPLYPSTPYTLSDSDVIKLGEETVITVEIDVKGEGFEGKSVEDVAKAGRVTRRMVAAGGKLGVVEGESGLGFGGIKVESDLKGDGFEEDVAKAGRVTRGMAAAGGKLSVVEGGSGLGLGFGVELRKNEKKVSRGKVKKSVNFEIEKEGGRLKKLGENVVDGGKSGVIEEEGELGFEVDGKKKVSRSRAKKNENVEILKEGGRLSKLGENVVEGGKSGVVEEEGELGFGVDGELETDKKKVSRSRAKKNGNVEILKEGGRLSKLLENVVDGGKSGVVEEEGELGVEVDGHLERDKKKVSRGRLKKNENAEILKEGGRIENLGENVVKDVVSAGLRRVTRSTRRKAYDEVKDGEEIGDAGTGRVTRGGRMTRSARIEEMSEIRGYDARGAENVDVVKKSKKKAPAKSRNKTGSISIGNCGVGENVVESGLVVNSEVIEGRSKRKLEVEVKEPESFENGQIREEEMGDMSYLREGDCGEGERNGDGDQVGSTPEKVCGDGLTDLRRANLNVLASLEKMTLGEWLDYIEDYLPKQIVAETEEMITEMRLNAERFHEFMLQQKAANGGGDIE